jgi:hypothetical protein
LPAAACRLSAEMAVLRPTARRRTGFGPRSRWASLNHNGTLLALLFSVHPFEFVTAQGCFPCRNAKESNVPSYL